MTKHSPEPWKYGDQYEQSDPGWYVSAKNGVVVCAQQDDTDCPLTEENAHRVVACVNACKGIPTEELEKDSRLSSGQAVDSMINLATDVARLISQYGNVDGEHHKQWLLDQTLRILLGAHYATWRAGYDSKGDGQWDEGIAP